MNPIISEALTLMLVGMITVFAILTIVVLSGKSLIALSNKLEAKPSTSQDDGVRNRGKQTGIPVDHIAAITATVHALTDGQGQVMNISERNR